MICVDIRFECGAKLNIHIPLKAALSGLEAVRCTCGHVASLLSAEVLAGVVAKDFRQAERN
jgi:hypothetical protein